ncbi:MAG TPA: TetR/AcrR family transcriptional regulator [Thermoleophilaceae bacterium]|nr:TetR/AcrR family transcriptional regulator [Thermoleophilaceae bacterium]
MTVTPWGDSRELRARKLRPGPGVPRADVEANQRERLYGAMVTAVADHGYEATRVADVLEISGVSRNTFYRHFDNKLDCFLATMDAIAVGGGDAVVSAYRQHDGSWDERLAAALDVLVAGILAQPAASRLYYVESYAAGPRAIAKVEQMGEQLEQLARHALDASPEHRGLPRDLLRAILRGFRRVFQTRLRSGREHELPEIAPQVLDWALGYTTPPEPLRQRSEPSRALFEPPAAADPADPRERILDAVVALMAERGYTGLTINDIAQRAGVSLTTFYDRFDGKDEAIVAALRHCGEQVLAAVRPAFQAAPDWPRGAAAAIDSFFAYLAIEQPFAQFGGVDVHLSSRSIVAVREEMLAGSQAFLADGFRAHPETPAIAGEAIGAAIDALLFDQIANWGSDRLYELAPIATYLVLVPFVGVEQACAIANSGP